ncbi:MAG: hypothetical protein WD187_04255 [Candidatus Woykebacteria bacterium]
MKKKRKLIKIASLSLAIAVAVWANGGLSFSLNNTAYAVGDLSIDWGVPSGDPIFVISDFKPGDMESRPVLVTNGGAGIRPVGVRGEKTSEIGELATVLDFIISENGTDLYGGTSATGPKSLQDFFDETVGMNSIFLSDLGPSDSTAYTFKATFDEAAGNEFQENEVVFDIIIGISVEVPEECGDIEFDGDPIFGTSSGDSINGTNGNDLIFGLEGGDSINGRGGDDCIVGGDEGDGLRGNSGNDVILGGAGGDSLRGNDGNDKLFGGSEGDSLRGGNGEDLLDGGTGSDSLRGGNDNDVLFGREGADSLRGGNGDDYLDGGPGQDGLRGGAGFDTCIDGESVKGCEP